jgi:hypothetical protein
MTIVLFEDLTTLHPSMLTAVQYNILPSSFIFPVYISTLDDITFSSLQSVLQTSGCSEAEVVIFAVDKYHCILLDGRAAFVVQENVCIIIKKILNKKKPKQTILKCYHFVSVPVSSATLLSTPTDKNPVEVVSNRDQTFSCTTNAARPSSRIQWYLSTANITTSASLQPEVCNTEQELKRNDNISILSALVFFY